MKNQKMIDYLTAVLELEKSCYEQNKILNKLAAQIKAYNNPKLNRYEAEPSEPKFDTGIGLLFSGDLVDSPLGTELGLAFVIFIVTFVLFIVDSSIDDSRSHTLGEVLGVVIGILLVLHAIKALFCCLRSLHYRKEYNEELAVVKQHNSDLGAKNNSIIAVGKNRAARLKCEGDKIFESLKRTQQALSQYYNIGIIYPKYRNIVSVASFLEYFSSERCDSLTGHEGAYNIYENEIRMNMIIQKLDDVLKSLEQIKSNQQTLYYAIDECNRCIKGVTNRLITSSEKISEQLANQSSMISSQLSSISYTNEITARNTNFLANIEMYKVLYNK